MAAAEARTCEHRGIALQCPVCQGNRFFTREYAMRTVEDEMFRQPWAADEVKAFVCERCSNILWFA